LKGARTVLRGGGGGNATSLPDRHELVFGVIMDNFDYSNIAIGAVIVGLLNLLIVVLIKTETILKYVEKIKAIIRLDYKSRAKRSDEEIKILKKHELVAREKVRHSYVTDNIWGCKWIWNWSANLEPINIRGYCLGDKKQDILDRWEIFECNHPVDAYFLLPQVQEEHENALSSKFIKLAILCSQDGHYPHRQKRAEFDVLKTETQDSTAWEVFEPIIIKKILGKRDVKIVQEMRKLKLKFWK
jgi:hypothetical protein